MPETIAVFCGAATGTSPEYEGAARTIAHWLTKRHATLVYGGGRFGLMGILAQTVLADGGRVIGIMPQNLYDRGSAMPGLSALHVVADMAIRKQQMLQTADVCLALPGGPGTLEEISEAFSWARIGDNNSPCILFNQSGYYEPLAAMFDTMVANGFLTATDRAKLLFSASLTEIDQFIANYQPPEVRSYLPRD